MDINLEKPKNRKMSTISTQTFSRNVSSCHLDETIKFQNQLEYILIKMLVIKKSTLEKLRAEDLTTELDDFLSLDKEDFLYLGIDIFETERFLSLQNYVFKLDHLPPTS